MQKLVVSIICCFLLSACSPHFPCEAEKGIETTSPNHQLTATVVYIGCGAMSKDATWVTLHRTGDKYDRSEDLVFTATQQNRLEIAWIDDAHLSVFCRCREDDVRFQVIKKSGINISYK
jgi:hypothetical protein